MMTLEQIARQLEATICAVNAVSNEIFLISERQKQMQLDLKYPPAIVRSTQLRDDEQPRLRPSAGWCAHTATGETIEVPPESATEGGDLHVQRLRARVARLEHLVAELIEARRREENDGR